MKKKYSIAVVGATGAVGEEMLKILGERKFPIRKILPLASERSEGKTVIFRGKEVRVSVLRKDSFKGIDIALFSAGGSVSKEFAPLAAGAGVVVIDNTSAFRQEPDVPLVVPEVNPEDIAGYTKRNIIANPNCSTIQMVVVLKPIHDTAVIKRVVVSTYQATSGAGRRAMDELSNQVLAIFNQGEEKVEVFPHQIAFNAIPHIDVFLPNAYSREEMKMVWETKKIMKDSSIRVTATTVRVPVFHSHGEAINIETRRKIRANKVREILMSAPGVVVADDPAKNVYPLPREATGKDQVFVGRIRDDESIARGINLWVVADNIRKGAALNAIQIAEILIEKYL